MIDDLIKKYDYPELHLEQALERISDMALDLMNADKADCSYRDTERLARYDSYEKLLTEAKRARDKWTEFQAERNLAEMR